MHLGRPRGPGTAAAWACHSGLQGPSDGLAGPVLQVTRAGWGRVVAFLWPPKHLPPPATPRVPVGRGQGGGVRPGSRPPFPGCWQSALPRGQRARPGPAHGPACPSPVTATPARSWAAPGTDPQPGSVRAAGAAHADHRARGRATGGTRTGGFPERPLGAWPTGRQRVSLTVRHRGAREAWLGAGVRAATSVCPRPAPLGLRGPSQPRARAQRAPWPEPRPAHGLQTHCARSAGLGLRAGERPRGWAASRGCRNVSALRACVRKQGVSPETPGHGGCCRPNSAPQVHVLNPNPSVTDRGTHKRHQRSPPLPHAWEPKAGLGAQQHPPHPQAQGTNAWDAEGGG